MSSIRILLIEDNEDDYEMLAAKLGFFRPPPPFLTRVSDLGSALTLLRTTSFDLILVDLGLPKWSPREVLDAVLTACGDAAVVILSAAGSYDLLQLALVTSVEGALKKDDDLTPGELERYMLQAISRRQVGVQRDIDFELLKAQVAHQEEEIRELRVEIARLQGREEGRTTTITVTKTRVALFVAVVTALATLAGALAGLF